MRPDRRARSTPRAIDAARDQFSASRSAALLDPVGERHHDDGVDAKLGVVGHLTDEAVDVAARQQAALVQGRLGDRGVRVGPTRRSTMLSIACRSQSLSFRGRAAAQPVRPARLHRSTDTPTLAKPTPTGPHGGGQTTNQRRGLAWVRVRRSRNWLMVVVILASRAQRSCRRRWYVAVAGGLSVPSRTASAERDADTKRSARVVGVRWGHRRDRRVQRRTQLSGYLVTRGSSTMPRPLSLVG